MAHTITVTRIFDDPEADTEDPEYTVAGECDWKCASYKPCEKAWHRHPQNDEGQYGYDEWSTKRVTHVHTFIDGEWMVPDGGCGLRWAFGYDNPEFRMTELGVYDVDVEWDGGDWLAHLTRREPTHSRPETPDLGTTEGERK